MKEEKKKFAKKSLSVFGGLTLGHFLSFFLFIILMKKNIFYHFKINFPQKFVDLVKICGFFLNEIHFKDFFLYKSKKNCQNPTKVKNKYLTKKMLSDLVSKLLIIFFFRFCDKSDQTDVLKNICL